jgi:hypothetical protein
MGFESFRVELRGGTASYSPADEFIRRLPHSKPDAEAMSSRGSSFYTLEDGSHVIEVEVAAAPVRISCRFTLCHPPSVDSAFLDLVRDLMTHLEMEARVCDDIRPGDLQAFPVTRFSEFADIVLRQVSTRRAEWVANFGPAQFPARTREVFERVILPRCQPVIGSTR